MPEGKGRRSTIGVDLLQGKSFEFSPSLNNFSFSHNERTKAFSFKLGSRGHIYLPVRYLSISNAFTGIWDTGAGLTLVDLADVQANQSDFTFLKNSEGGDTTGASLTLPIYEAKNLNVGALEFHDIKVVAADLSGIRDAIGEDVRVAIGYNVISRYNWYFNLENRRWRAFLSV